MRLGKIKVLKIADDSLPWRVIYPLTKDTVWHVRCNSFEAAMTDLRVTDKMRAIANAKSRRKMDA